MKAFMISILLVFLATAGFSQRKIKMLDVKEEGSSIKISYQPILDKIESNGISVRITPVSAEELNRQFSRNNRLNGKFDYSYYEKSRDSYFLKKQKKQREKSDLEFILEGIDWLFDNEKINQEEYDVLYNLVQSNYSSDFKSELSDVESMSYSNPYFLGDIYMNVFKIDLVNSTNSVSKFDENLIIKNGDKLLTKLSSDFLRTELEKLNTRYLNKSLTLERYNLEPSLILPPNSTTTKYFSVLPIDLSSDKIEIILPNYSKSLSWKVIKNQHDINEQYSFYEFVLDYKLAGQNHTGIAYSILTGNSSQSAYIVNSKLFINSKDTEKNIEIFTLAHYFDKLYFSRQSNIKANTYLDLKKNKRSTIMLDTEEMTEVKKKIR